MTELAGLKKIQERIEFSKEAKFAFEQFQNDLREIEAELNKYYTHIQAISHWEPDSSSEIYCKLDKNDKCRYTKAFLTIIAKIHSASEEKKEG